MFHWKLCLLQTSKGFIDKVTTSREKKTKNHHINMGEMFSLASRRHQWEKKKKKKEKLRFQEVENGLVKWKAPWQLSGIRHFVEYKLGRSEMDEFTYRDLFICVFAALVIFLYYKSYCDKCRHRQVAHRISKAKGLKRL